LLRPKRYELLGFREGRAGRRRLAAEFLEHATGHREEGGFTARERRGEQRGCILTAIPPSNKAGYTQFTLWPAAKAGCPLTGRSGDELAPIGRVYSLKGPTKGFTAEIVKTGRPVRRRDRSRDAVVWNQPSEVSTNSIPSSNN
jgi:hypothetical protein